VRSLTTNRQVDPISPGDSPEGLSGARSSKFSRRYWSLRKAASLLSCVQWNILWFGNGIKVRGGGHRNPVISPNPSVAAGSLHRAPPVATGAEAGEAAQITCEVDCGMSCPANAPCNPGELGVVISRYTRIGRYDWIAMPLLPYFMPLPNQRYSHCTQTASWPPFSEISIDGRIWKTLRRTKPQEISRGRLGPTCRFVVWPHQLWFPNLNDRGAGWRTHSWLNSGRTQNLTRSSRGIARTLFATSLTSTTQAVSRAILADLDVATPNIPQNLLWIQWAALGLGIFEASSFPRSQEASEKQTGPAAWFESVFKAKKYVLPLLCSILSWPEACFDLT